MAETFSSGPFWDDSVGAMDPADALAVIAARLFTTAQRMGARLNEQDRRRDQAACECCGWDPSGMDRDTAEMFRFCIKESGSLFTMIQKLGLAERAVRAHEAQVGLLSQAMVTLFDHLGLSEAQQIESRAVVLNRLLELEGALPNGALPDGEKSGAMAILDVEVVEPEEDLAWLS